MFGNFPRSIEFAVLWTSTFIEFCARNNITYADAPQSKVDEWTQHVFDCAKGLLANEVDSWMTGVNKNVKTKQKRIIARYNGEPLCLSFGLACTNRWNRTGARLPEEMLGRERTELRRSATS